MVVVTHAGRDRLRIEVRGHEVYTDQPVEDGGDDSAPTPTELFVASLAACIAFYAERFLRRNGLTTDGLKVTSEYEWAENPHRVGGIDLAVVVPGLTDAKREAFARVVEHCTVHNTLNHPPAIRLSVAAVQVPALSPPA
jgi:putative redox protein